MQRGKQRVAGVSDRCQGEKTQSHFFAVKTLEINPGKQGLQIKGLLSCPSKLIKMENRLSGHEL